MAGFILHMNQEIVLETARRTVAGTISFPEVVQQLIATGVEYYHVDYITQRQTCYGPQGETAVAPLALDPLPPVAPELSVAGLKAAILDSQRHGQKFTDFSRRAVEAGVHGYYAFLRGQRVTYFGRKGDQHTEWFPGAQP